MDKLKKFEETIEMINTGQIEPTICGKTREVYIVGDYAYKKDVNGNHNLKEIELYRNVGQGREFSSILCPVLYSSKNVIVMPRCRNICVGELSSSLSDQYPVLSLVYEGYKVDEELSMESRMEMWGSLGFFSPTCLGCESIGIDKFGLVRIMSYYNCSTLNPQMVGDGRC